MMIIRFSALPIWRTERTGRAALDILGWKHARTGDGDKGLEFAAKFDVLGMSINLGALHEGSVVLTNKEGRVARVCNMLKEVRHDGSLAKHQGQVLLGLLRFAAGFYSSMTLKHVFVDLNRFVHSIASPGQDALQRLCDRAIEALETLPSRCISVDGERRILHVYTDGSREGGVGSLGGVVFDVASGVGRVFQGRTVETAINSLRKWQPVYRVILHQTHKSSFQQWMVQAIPWLFCPL